MPLHASGRQGPSRYYERVSATLPRLRADLDLMPSPAEDRPGLLIRDSFRYSEVVLIIPPPLVPLLEFFDGEHTESDLRDALFRATGELELGRLLTHLINTLSDSGFLENERFDQLRQARHNEFASMPVREPAHAGSAYPTELPELQSTMQEWMDGASVAGSNSLTGIAAPHVSPCGGYESYRSAYRLLGPEYQDRTFVVLGTSHYGAPDRFGLTRKPYSTPFGETIPASDLTEELLREAPEASHPRRLLPRRRALDRVSGALPAIDLRTAYPRPADPLRQLRRKHLSSAAQPEQNGASSASSAPWAKSPRANPTGSSGCSGIDMAHMGRRYGDRIHRDRRRRRNARRGRARPPAHGALTAGDAAGFWDLVQENQRRSEMVRLLARSILF